MASESVAQEGPVSESFQSALQRLQDMQENKEELLTRVHTLKKELADWRVKLDSQVKSYQGELGVLRGTLNSEVEELRTEFQSLRMALRSQLEATATLAKEAQTQALEK